MSISSLLALALDPGRIFQALGRTADSWQRDLLLCADRQLLLNCSRQAGKSTVVAALALHSALFTRSGALILVVAPTLRQSEELYRKILQGYEALGRPVAVRSRSRAALELANGSRIVSLPGREATIRAFSGVRLLLLDEAARIPDAVYRTVRPMLAVSRGRLVALSTPNGCQGWFYREWTGGGTWRRFQIPWRLCSRITPEFIAEERLALGDAWIRQEYETDFLASAGRVYPDWESALVETPPSHDGRRVGGIDFGWRAPFAAVWGILDRDDVLWILGERYLSETPIQDHAAALKPLGAIVWEADPAGPAERIQLIGQGLCVRPANNHLFLGISAVTTRLRTGRLRIVRAACPNLVREGRLYRYPGEPSNGESSPVGRDDHALDALRYLVVRLDASDRMPDGDQREETPQTEGESNEAGWEWVR